jgi:hypothetical protein
MGLVAEMPPAAERPQMSAGAPEMDFVAEADRIRRSQKHFMKVPGSLPPVGKMKHEKEAAISQVRTVFRTGFRIRIDLMRIRIRIRIQQFF